MAAPIIPQTNSSPCVGLGRAASCAHRGGHRLCRRGRTGTHKGIPSTKRENRVNRSYRPRARVNKAWCRPTFGRIWQERLGEAEALERRSGMKSRSLHDDFVLSHRATKRTLNLLRAYSSIWEEERDSVGALASTAVVFLTNRECPFRIHVNPLSTEWRNSYGFVLYMARRHAGEFNLGSRLRGPGPARRGVEDHRPHGRQRGSTGCRAHALRAR